jgi:hypothetical protein
MAGQGGDGFKPGTNYNHRLNGRWPGPAEQIAAHLAQQLACREGNHAVLTAEAGRRTRIGGREIPPGTVYCSCCKRVKDEPGWTPIVADNGIIITPVEAAVIAALREVADVWPESLTLLSKDSGLCVVHTADYQAGRVEGAAGADFVIADIDGIPNDGGGW